MKTITHLVLSKWKLCVYFHIEREKETDVRCQVETGPLNASLTVKHAPMTPVVPVRNKKKGGFFLVNL